MRTKEVGICIVMAFALMALVAQAAERVFPLDLVKQHEANEKLQIKELAPGEYEWSLSDGMGQRLEIDLKKFGVDPKDYDELRFDLKPQGSQVALHAMLFGMPGEKDVCSWYTKFRTGTGEWGYGRFELRVDDDGAMYPDFPDLQKGVLRFELGPRILGFPGEPKWRKAILRNPRLIKWAVAADFEPRDVKIVTNDSEVSYTFPLRLKNRMDKPVKANIEIDPEKGLKVFKTEPSGTTSVELSAGAEKIVPIRIFMTAKAAKALAPGYGERICPKVSVEGVADSEVQPLLGYRNMYMWAVVPVNNEPWTPAKLQARVAESAKSMKVDDWKKGIISWADAALKNDFPAYDWWSKPGTKPAKVPHWGNSYRCPSCDGQMRQVTPNDIHHHVCGKCGKTFENDPRLDQCARQEYFAGRFKEIRTLAMAWLLTGDEKYAEKSLAIMLAYADTHPTMTVTDYRSTAYGTRLNFNTLIVSWCLPDFAEGYSLLTSFPGLDAAKRQRIETFLIDEGLRVQRHGGEFSNQQAEHLRTYGTVALVSGYWPLLGEALHGDFGWNPMVEFAYSDDGINHEGQAYHRAQFGAMNNFAYFAAERGLDLMTPRFKRVFDASLTLGMAEGAAYELAYRQYRDPTYLVTLAAGRKYPGERAIFSGVLDLPKATEVKLASKLMDGMGYIFLRRGTAADYREIRLNYKEQFDRTEHDRFGATFYRNGIQVDSGIGRCNYADPGAHFMYATPAHNTIVIDGQDSRDVISDLLVWQGDSDTPLAVVATDPKATLYEGVRQLRGIALLEDAYLVLDRVVCDQPRTIDRYQYGVGKGAFTIPLQAPAKPPAKLPEAGGFTDIATGAAGKELRIGFEKDLNMRLVCDQDMVVGKAQTPLGGWRPPKIEVTWARVDNCREATFLAVYSLGKDAEPPAAKIVKSTDDEIVIEIKGKDKTRILTVKPKAKKAVVK